MTASEQTSSARSGNWLANQPYLLLSITALCWAGNAIVGRMAAGHIAPVTLSFLRWSFAFLIILPFAWKHLVRDWAAIRGRLGIMIVLSITGIGAFNTLQYWALEHTQALNTLLLQSAGPAGGGGMVADAARGTADAGAGGRRRAVDGRRAGHPDAWRPHQAFEHRVQPRRPDLHRRAGDLRPLFGAVAEATRHPRPCPSSPSPSAPARPA